MNIKFNTEESEFELHEGTYDIYFKGGFNVKMGDLFNIKIIDKITNEEIKVDEYFFKLITFNNWKRAVKYFYFNIMKTSNYKVLIYHWEDCKMKKSTLLLKNLFQKDIAPDIEIEKK